MFDQAELAQLIGGEDKLIDMDDLEKFAHVSGYPNDKTIKAFWKVVKSFNQEQRRGLVKFVTSCARPPLYVSSSSSPPTPLYRGVRRIGRMLMIDLALLI
jgi:ubiquitin-protein ligase E3 C